MYVEQDNEMKKFIHFCKQNGIYFTDEMLKYESVDKNMMVYFYNISMHIFSNYSYRSRILFHNFSDVVTSSEEAFALLVLENNFDRWVYQAERQRRKQIGIDDDNDAGEVPDVLYQKKVQKRKDNVYTAGRWTDDGLARFNDLLSKVQEVRELRREYEEELYNMYVESEPSDSFSSKVEKRNREERDEAENQRKKKVVVMNVLNVAEL